eukprot:gnl/TRDRNA2_/TRDRNA2_179453_c0_seq1.p1 gnl/TRDRNA2_/TRDRNA2_179453_c0~~gnl/TRDRNA2_/TRDRNA2_179453_c0_seq1.p1  ORF type:complete len:617 (+),score=162.25 gnl/TRDRNA2_/TRDRNA2_179453_c0_seq1:63-1913(+)
MGKTAGVKHAAKKKAMNKKPLVMSMKRTRLGRTSLRGALVASLKEQGGRKDLKFASSEQVCTNVMNTVKIEDRAGYPPHRAPGSVDPKKWVTKGGKQVMIDFYRDKWLPDDWAQGVKTTEATAASGSGKGGTYKVYMAPDGETFYHKPSCEQHAGRTFSEKDGWNGQARLAKLQATQAIQLARMAIKDVTAPESNIGVDSDASFFKLLSDQERKFILPKERFHFCVVSARRASSIESVKDIYMVETQFREAGVTPTWYVDEASLADYQALGLSAVVGGKLTPARNKCLDDAASKGKICVQASDDISAWEYRSGKKATSRTDDAVNAAHAAAKRFVVSPVAAAQFILAKMRGCDDLQPRLGGVYMLGSCARTFAGDEVRRHHFILGDFFVVDKSDVRFDENMTLKEDYDFTCAHIHAHGSVMRCERMTLNVKHYSNKGGAVAVRDNKGKEEQKNIATLFKKWPGSFRMNPKRKNEVIMRWKTEKKGDDDDDDGEDAAGPADAKTKRVAKAKSSIAKRPNAAAAMKTKGVRAVAKRPKAKAVSKPKVAKGLPADSATLMCTDKEPQIAYIAKRCKQIGGKTVGAVLGKLKVVDSAGNPKFYGAADLKYDLLRGYLTSQ